MWTGGRRVRFRGARHYPHRLLFSLHLPGNQAKMEGMCVESGCGTEGCVNPEHQTLATYKPPAKKRKRAGAPRGKDEEEEARREFAEAKRLREQLLEMHAALQRVAEAKELGKHLPLHERLDRERDAAGLAPFEDVVEEGALQRYADNPYSMFLEARDGLPE